MTCPIKEQGINHSMGCGVDSPNEIAKFNKQSLFVDKKSKKSAA